ncbi:MAG: hypothetical protein HY686_06085 [Chloroflexi bacterium]|nr:hypothetical protein [Chloroflexota bacterium]
MSLYVLEVKDFRGRWVRLARSNFQRHLTKHPEIGPYLEVVKTALADPDVVVEADNGATYFYRLGLGQGKLQGCYLLIVVYFRRVGDLEENALATFYFTTRITDEGEVVWRRPG